MKARTMVYLEPERLEALRTEAKDRRISLAEFVRRARQTYLEGNRVSNSIATETYLKIVGLGSCGGSDVSEQHDLYLGEALDREHTG